MKLGIETADNGLILVDDEGQSHVFEEQDDNEVEHLRAMLYYVVDSLGMSGSRYSEHRIYIEIRPGDKFGDSNETTQISLELTPQDQSLKPSPPKP